MAFAQLAAATMFDGVDLYPIVKWLSLAVLIRLGFWFATRIRKRIHQLRR